MADRLADLGRELLVSTAVTVIVVTHDSAGTLGATLACVGELVHRPLDLLVVDCGSVDASREIARSEWPSGVPGRLIELGENRGFTGGSNAGLEASEAPWVLSLNPDARPRPDFVSRLVATGESDSRIGAVTGRLVRTGTDPEGRRVLDACGMRLVPTWRHLDRGSGRVDRGQLGRRARVFGATGAATLYRRAALADVAFGREAFDEGFHSYREDAEISFRLRERGWEVVYEPEAVAFHDRFNLPERRSRMPATINFHSLKNRYLLRLYHQTVGNLLWTLPFTLWRDFLALAWVLAAERSSLPAYRWVWRRRREILARRRAIQARRTVPPRAIDRWFLRSELPWPGAAE